MNEYSCIQMAIGDICKCDYEQLRYFSFAAFGLDYANRLNSEKICKKLRLKRIMHFTEFYKKNFGIDICEWRPESNAWQNIMEGLRTEKKILLGFDCYYAPWSPSYRQTHMLHFCQVIGIDEPDKLVCIDSYMNALNVTWRREEFEKAYKVGYYVTADAFQKRIAPKEILSWIKNAVSIDSIKEDYKKLLKEFSKIEKYEDLFETDNPEACEIIIVTKQISKNYATCADIIKEWSMSISLEKLEVLESSYQHLSDNWNMIAQLLLYMLLKRKIVQESMDNIQSHMEDNLVWEIKVLKLIDEILA